MHDFNVDASNYTDAEHRAWKKERRKLAPALLKRMGDYLGYSFPDLDIETQVYFPVAHGDLLTEQAMIRKGVASVLGRAGLPIQAVGLGTPQPQVPQPTQPQAQHSPSSDQP
ncbi:hypothetical protein HTY53_06810 [Cupriavidus gilardii]|nr:DUF6680 family protein [Cupriavidus gilardii]NSX03499.1 hypothetical protein [Cupriavidus gilardii]